MKNAEKAGELVTFTSKLTGGLPGTIPRPVIAVGLMATLATLFTA
jgi:hypothetical protein